MTHEGSVFVLKVNAECMIGFGAVAGGRPLRALI